MQGHSKKSGRSGQKAPQERAHQCPFRHRTRKRAFHANRVLRQTLTDTDTSRGNSPRVPWAPCTHLPLHSSAVQQLVKHAVGKHNPAAGTGHHRPHIRRVQLRVSLLRCPNSYGGHMRGRQGGGVVAHTHNGGAERVKIEAMTSSTLGCNAGRSGTELRSRGGTTRPTPTWMGDEVVDGVGREDGGRRWGCGRRWM